MSNKSLTMNKPLIALVVANLLLAGCASTTPNADVSTGGGSTKAPTTDTSTQADTRGSGQPPKVEPKVDPLKTGKLAERSVYFEYDKYDVKEEFRSLVEAHGKFLAGNPSRSVRIEGNADERGSREYNLALGQKRAEAVRRALTSFGASEKQLEATSNGEEKPKATGHDEKSWATNRRADLFYPGE